MSRILVTWVGEADLRAAAGSDGGVGPIARAIAARTFDEIRLLLQTPRAQSTEFISWLWERTSVTVVPHFVNTDHPTSFRDVYLASSVVVQSIVDRQKAVPELVFNLSSGTSAMAAAWIVLGRTRYPAELIQSSKGGGVETVDVPLDISTEFISSGDRLLERGVVRSPGKTTAGEIAYQSPGMAAAVRRAERAAISDVTVLIEGEPGVEKEVLARSIHDLNRRAKRTFRTVNCGAFPGDLIESILFGRESVVLAALSEELRGELEKASGSTLFLDEISELPPKAQARLLRVLLDGAVTRVGGREPIPVDVRIIAATSCDLANEVAKERFREDLFYRLTIATIRMPPLREMKDDLPNLIDHFLEDANHQYAGLTPKKLSVGARNELITHRWPGNVRELRNTLTRLVVWSEGHTISPNDVRQNLLSVSQVDGEGRAGKRPFEAGFKLEDVLDGISRGYIEKALEETGGVKAKAVELLGMSNATTLTNWMKRLGMKAGSRK